MAKNRKDIKKEFEIKAEVCELLERMEKDMEYSMDEDGEGHRIMPDYDDAMYAWLRVKAYEFIIETVTKAL